MRSARPIHLLRLFHGHRRQAASHESGARPETQSHIKPVGGGLPAMRPARPTHLLCLSHSHRQQSFPQSGARPEIQGHIKPVGGGLPAMRPARPIYLLRLFHGHRRQSLLPPTGPSRGLTDLHESYSAPNTFLARLVAAAAGLARMLSSCLAIISNRPLSACSAT